MKNKKIMLLLTIPQLLFCVGCKSTDTTGSIDVFRYVNESGVEVAIVGEVNEYANMPDSIVLQNSMSYEHSVNTHPTSSVNYFFPYNLGGQNEYPPTDYIPIKIYYNKTICMSYIKTDKGKNPTKYWEEEYYIKTRQEKKKKKDITIIDTYTYTFTAEDYQNALKAQE